MIDSIFVKIVLFFLYTIVYGVEVGDKFQFSEGSYQLRGRRGYQEDMVTAESYKLDNGEKLLYYAVFDGHGGDQASLYAVRHLHHTLFGLLSSLEVSETNIKVALTEAFVRTDDEFLETGKTSGSAAITVLVYNNTLFTANAGDCRAILSVNGISHPLSDDHKPHRPDEKKRLEEAGSTVEFIFGISRVDGVLAMSRAIGDRHLKHSVISEPEITVVDLLKLSGKPNFFVIASDGLWDVFSNQEVIDFVLANPQLHGNPKLMASALVDIAYLYGGLDNITVQIIFIIENSESDKDSKAHSEL